MTTGEMVISGLLVVIIYQLMWLIRNSEMLVRIGHGIEENTHTPPPLDQDWP